MTGPSWWPPCKTEGSKSGLPPCTEHHCNNDTKTGGISHDWCNCRGAYTSRKKQGHCPSSVYTPIPMRNDPKFPGGCYCCCGCFANGTPVAANQTQYKAIEEFSVGDLVYTADDIHLTSWSQKTVRFSSGTGNSGLSTLIKVNYGNPGQEDYLLVNRQQIFLMADGKLKAAAKLVPGKDSLVLGDGSKVPVNSLELGKFQKGLHHIATTSEPAQTADGHLILAKNVVCGDYALQQAMISNDATRKLLVDGHDEHDKHPEFGTKQYVNTHKHLVHHPSGFHSIHPETQPAAISHKDFERHSEKKAIIIPGDAKSFLSQKQANDIWEKGNIAPHASGAGHLIIPYLFTLFKGFYPEVVFELDDTHHLPNAYSFKDQGQSRVVITDALLRHREIKFESLALVIANGLGYFNDTPPLDNKGYTCEGQAAYLAVAVILPRVFFDLRATPIMRDGIAQIKEFFNDISAQNRAGIPGNTCTDIGIDCRVQAMENAFSMLPLPHCAGGPPDPALEVVRGDLVEHLLSDAYYEVLFNADVDPETATALGNYVFTPKVKVSSAKIDPKQHNLVKIKGDFQRDGKYELLVKDVLSIKKEPLVDGRNQVKLTETIFIPPGQEIEGSSVQNML